MKKLFDCFVITAWGMVVIFILLAGLQPEEDTNCEERHNQDQYRERGVR